MPTDSTIKAAMDKNRKGRADDAGGRLSSGGKAHKPTSLAATIDAKGTWKGIGDKLAAGLAVTIRKYYVDATKKSRRFRANSDTRPLGGRGSSRGHRRAGPWVTSAGACGDSDRGSHALWTGQPGATAARAFVST